MIFVLLLILIAVTFGFVFSKLDTLTKISKILRDDISKLEKDIDDIKSKKN